MDDRQYEKLIRVMDDIKNLLILNVSKSGATSAEIAKVIGVADSRVRQILTGNSGKRKKIPTKFLEEENNNGK